MKKILKLKYIAEYALIVVGVILSAFPQIVKWIFYLSGGLIILFNIIRYLIYRNKKNPYSMIKMIFYVIIGGGLIILPTFLEIGIPLVAGSFIMMNGFERFVNAFMVRNQEKKWVLPLVVGIIYFFFGFYVLAEYKHISETIIRVIGVFLVVIGIAKQINKINDNKSEADKTPKVLEVNSYKVDD